MQESVIVYVPMCTCGQMHVCVLICSHVLVSGTWPRHQYPWTIIYCKAGLLTTQGSPLSALFQLTGNL